MSELVVVGFSGTHRAAEVLNEVIALNASAAIDLVDAVAVYRTTDGRLRVDASVQPTSTEKAAWGGLLGALLGALLAAPVTSGVTVAVAATRVAVSGLAGGATGALVSDKDAEYRKEKTGISEKQLQQIGGMVQPGQSAVFVRADTQFPEEVAETFRGAGGTILSTTLPPTEAARLQAINVESVARP